MNYNNYTICAIATALSPSGIGIIRISGDKAIEIAKKILINKNNEEIKLENHKIKYGYVFDKERNEILDEVIVLTFFAPHSYTSEDVVEIQTHGNNLVLKSILQLLVKNGCSIAEPGEFTKRAFLNGKIDLSKAEAIADLINCQNEYQKKASIKGLRGCIEEEVKKIRAEILEAMAYIESALDDPEHISLENYDIILKDELKKIIYELDKMINNANNGKVLVEGINVCILGKTNAGKSSLLNLLLNENRSIVTDIAGTTRDVIKESINVSNLTLNIIDTAGIRDEENIDLVEKIGIDKARYEAKNSDLIIFMKDIKDINLNDYKNLNIKNSVDDQFIKNFLTKDDCNILNNVNNKPVIILLNKIDLYDDKKYIIENIVSKINSIIDKNELCHIYENINIKQVMAFSNREKENKNKLIDIIEKLFIISNIDFNNEIVITNERQLDNLIKAKNALNNVIISIDNKMSEDFWTIDLSDCYTNLSQIIGENVEEDLINEIFSKFCMGK